MPQYPATEDNAGHILHLIDTPGFSSPTLVSGTAYQNATNDWATAYVQVALGAAGTVKVELSLDGTTYNTIIPITAANAASAQSITVRVPPNAYMKVTVAVATISSCGVVTD